MNMIQVDRDELFDKLVADTFFRFSTREQISPSRYFLVKERSDMLVLGVELTPENRKKLLRGAQCEVTVVPKDEMICLQIISGGKN